MSVRCPMYLNDVDRLKSNNHVRSKFFLGPIRDLYRQIRTINVSKAIVGPKSQDLPIGFGGGDTNLYGYVAGDPINHIDPMGLATDLLCRAVGGSGGSAGGMHCFLRITPEAESSLGSAPITLSLLTPDMKVGNKYINAGVDSGSGSFRASVDNGKCNTPGGQDKIDQAVMASFNSQPNGTPYSPIPYGGASNSNAFIHRVLKGAGLTVIPSAPLGAVGY